MLHNHLQRPSEGPQLELQWNARSGVQPDLADDGGALHQLLEPPGVERLLGPQIARVAPCAPGDIGLASVDDEGRLVEGEGHGQDGP